MKKEIDAFRAKESTAEVKPTDILNHQGSASGIQWWMIALPAAVVVLGGAAAVIVVKKKKGTGAVENAGEKSDGSN